MGLWHDFWRRLKATTNALHCLGRDTKSVIRRIWRGP